MPTTDRKRPTCIYCTYYFVTHDPAQPHGCRAMGFKSAQNPAAVVFSSSRLECQMFQAKQQPKKPAEKPDNSDGGLVA